MGFGDVTGEMMVQINSHALAVAVGGAAHGGERRLHHARPGGQGAAGEVGVLGTGEVESRVVAHVQVAENSFGHHDSAGAELRVFHGRAAVHRIGAGFFDCGKRIRQPCFAGHAVVVHTGQIIGTRVQRAVQQMVADVGQSALRADAVVHRQLRTAGKFFHHFARTFRRIVVRHRQPHLGIGGKIHAADGLKARRQHHRPPAGRYAD